jgi:hypothetical protein
MFANMKMPVMGFIDGGVGKHVESLQRAQCLSIADPIAMR